MISDFDSSRIDIGAVEAGDQFVCLDCCFLFADLSWFNLGLKGWLGLRFHSWVFHGVSWLGFSWCFLGWVFIVGLDFHGWKTGGFSFGF